MTLEMPVALAVRFHSWARFMPSRGTGVSGGIADPGHGLLAECNSSPSKGIGRPSVLRAAVLAYPMTLIQRQVQICSLRSYDA